MYVTVVNVPYAATLAIRSPVGERAVRAVIRLRRVLATSEICEGVAMAGRTRKRGLLNWKAYGQRPELPAGEHEPTQNGDPVTRRMVEVAQKLRTQNPGCRAHVGMPGGRDAVWAEVQRRYPAFRGTNWRDGAAVSRFLAEETTRLSAARTWQEVVYGGPRLYGSLRSRRTSPARG